MMLQVAVWEAQRDPGMSKDSGCRSGSSNPKPPKA